MGGAVQAVTKPVGRAFKGLTGQTEGIGGPASAPSAPAEKAVDRASRSQEEMGARMRGARRRARGLLAQENLGGEMETLGGGNSL